jgi:hypothetical protein
MIRSVDVQLTVAATASAVVVVLARGRWLPGRTVGATTVAVALLVAIVVDRRWIEALSAERGMPERWLVLVGWGVLVGVGAARAARRDASGLALPGLCAAAGVGIWLGVPETSYAILAVGLIVGLAVGGRMISGTLRPSGAAAMALLLVIAGSRGAVDIDQALVGAVLATAPLVALGVVPMRHDPSDRAVAGSIVLALIEGVCAGRLVGVHRTWDGLVLAGALCVVLASASAYAWRADA